MEKDSDASYKASSGESSKPVLTVTTVTTDVSNDLDETQPEYRLYRRRFVGQVALVRSHSNSYPNYTAHAERY